MKPQTISMKMQEYVQGFREQLAKEDWASIATLTENTGAFFRELIQELPESGTVGQEVEFFIACVDRFGTACRQKDMEKAAQTLAEMERVLESVQSQYDFA